ncbi:MAG: ABC transporter ATP-binding protein [Candidatus Caldarchaeum sp.]
MVGVEVKELVKVYRHGVKGRLKTVTALDRVTLSVKEGVFTILGPTGCGKTTTLRCIAGLETPDSGEITIGDKTVYGNGIIIPPEERGIGMVFQSYAIWPHMTVFENVAFPLRARKYSKAEIQKLVKSALELVDLAGFEDRPATTLSGGQQQRVALARALVHSPNVLLLDEPLSNLDAKLRYSMRIELRRLLKELGITTVFVTHDQIEALSISDCVAIMNNGRIIETGPPTDIYEKPRHPFTAEFVGSVNVLNGSYSPHKGVIYTMIGELAVTGGVELNNVEKVSVYIRPEDVEFSRTAKGLDNEFVGVVEGSSFMGHYTEVLVRVGDLLIRSWTAKTSGFKKGEKAYIRLNSEKLIVFAHKEQQH